MARSMKRARRDRKRRRRKDMRRMYGRAAPWFGIDRSIGPGFMDWTTKEIIERAAASIAAIAPLPRTT